MAGDEVLREYGLKSAGESGKGGAEVVTENIA